MPNSGGAGTSQSAQHGLQLPSHPILTSHAPGDAVNDPFSFLHQGPPTQEEDYIAFEDGGVAG